MMFSGTGADVQYERVTLLQDRTLGLRAIVAIHSTARGPAFGGIRRARYADEDKAWVDALALAEAMTLKCALSGLPAGGAKTVVMVPLDGEADWPDIYRRLGAVIEELGGGYVCGPDIGTSETELDWVREQTGAVNPRCNDPAASTANGVMACLRAVRSDLGFESLSGLRVAVQGLGAVGRNVATQLVEAGAQVFAADPRYESGDAPKLPPSVELMPTQAILETPCDILVPCAVGQVLTRTTVPRLRCRAVCGSANNQLLDDEAAMLLMRAGILHVPDIIASAGAVIEGVLTVRHGESSAVREQILAVTNRLESVCSTVLAEAKRRNVPPSRVARERGRDAVRAVGKHGCETVGHDP